MPSWHAPLLLRSVPDSTSSPVAASFIVAGRTQHPFSVSRRILPQPNSNISFLRHQSRTTPASLSTKKYSRPPGTRTRQLHHSAVYRKTPLKTSHKSTSGITTGEMTSSKCTCSFGSFALLFLHVLVRCARDRCPEIVQAAGQPVLS
jgi:hypothetical protein